MKKTIKHVGSLFRLYEEIQKLWESDPIDVKFFGKMSYEEIFDIWMEVFDSLFDMYDEEKVFEALLKFRKISDDYHGYACILWTLRGEYDGLTKEQYTARVRQWQSQGDENGRNRDRIENLQ